MSFSTEGRLVKVSDWPHRKGHRCHAREARPCFPGLVEAIFSGNFGAEDPVRICMDGPLGLPPLAAPKLNPHRAGSTGRCPAPNSKSTFAGIGNEWEAER